MILFSLITVMMFHNIWLFVLVFAGIKIPGDFFPQRWPKPPDPKKEFLSWTREGDLLLFVRTIPKAPVSIITGIFKNRVNIAVQGRPGSPHAKHCLIELLSKILNIPSEKFSIIKGVNSTFKTISIERNTIRYGQVYSKIVSKHVIPFMLNFTTSTERPSTKVYYYYDDDDEFDYDEEYYKELEKEEELAKLRGEQLSDDSYYYENKR